MGKSPPESGGDPSRSEGGAVCSKFAQHPFNFAKRSVLIDDPYAEYLYGPLRANFEQIFRLRPVGLALRPAPASLREASPPNLGGEFAPSQHLRPLLRVLRFGCGVVALSFLCSLLPS